VFRRLDRHLGIEVQPHSTVEEEVMDHQSSSSDDLKQVACQTAWAALAQDNPQAAAESLREFAHLSATDLEVAEVWATMLGWVNELDHLERESRRLAQRWANQSQVVLPLVTAILKCWGRQPGLLGPAPRESVIGLGVDLIDLCLSEAPPSKPKDRALLYVLRARLLLCAGPLGDDRALSDYEIATSLCPNDEEIWFLLARHHLLRGRWEKSILAANEAHQKGFDELKVAWMIAVAQTALAPHQVTSSFSIDECWQLAKNSAFIDEAKPDLKGRWVSAGIERQRVAVHSHMIRIGGGWELTENWCSEVVLVQPLSPCHGRILHPCQNQLPADFDDLIIWDPQPVDFIEMEGEQRPILRGLAVLEKGAAVVRSFPQIRLNDAELNTLNQSLPEGVFFYQGPKEESHPQAHGKLCWPRTKIAQEVISEVKRVWQSLDLPTL
jgi:hypothetical protein